MACTITSTYESGVVLFDPAVTYTSEWTINPETVATITSNTTDNLTVTVESSSSETVDFTLTLTVTQDNGDVFTRQFTDKHYRYNYYVFDADPFQQTNGRGFLSIIMPDETDITSSVGTMDNTPCPPYSETNIKFSTDYGNRTLKILNNSLKPYKNHYAIDMRMQAASVDNDLNYLLDVFDSPEDDNNFISPGEMLYSIAIGATEDDTIDDTTLNACGYGLAKHGDQHAGTSTLTPAFLFAFAHCTNKSTTDLYFLFTSVDGVSSTTYGAVESLGKGQYRVETGVSVLTGELKVFTAYYKNYNGVYSIELFVDGALVNTIILNGGNLGNPYIVDSDPHGINLYLSMYLDNYDGYYKLERPYACFRHVNRKLMMGLPRAYFNCRKDVNTYLPAGQPAIISSNDSKLYNGV